jgi:DNA-binding MarR family transcriptional regulator/N-acetylglutamate synthase-like GNAT family acetyltransferase
VTSTAALRRFNRSYTQRIGVLEDSFLGLGMPLASVRLVFEIGTQPTTIQALRARLGLDSGYLSRLVRGLERQGYVTVQPDVTDRRRRVLTLTDDGRKLLVEIEARSEAKARAILDPLSPRQRERLAEALATADLLVRAATVNFERVDPADPLAREAVTKYFAELNERFENGFDPGPLGPADDEQYRPPQGVFVVARSDGEPVAGGGVRAFAGAGEIKRMWVHPDWRGAGLGSRMLRRLEEEAVALGHRVVRLDTRHVLTEAIALYERSGYQRIERYNDNPYATHFYEKRLAA